MRDYTNSMTQPEGPTNSGNTCMRQQSQIKIQDIVITIKMGKMLINLKYINSHI